MTQVSRFRCWEEIITCSVHRIYKVSIHNSWLPVFLGPSHLFWGSIAMHTVFKFSGWLSKMWFLQLHNNVFFLILYVSSIIPNALLCLLAVELHAVPREKSGMISWSLPCIVIVQLEPTMHKNRTISPLYALICIIAAEFHCGFIAQSSRIAGSFCTCWQSALGLSEQSNFVSSAELFSWLRFFCLFPLFMNISNTLQHIFSWNN